MKAIAVTRIGAEPQEITLEKPVVKPGQILVKLAAAGLNPFDWRVADGLLNGKLPHIFPLVLGVDGAGEVEATASDVTRFRPGDRVVGSFLFGVVGAGSYAQYAAIDQHAALAMVPDAVSLNAAAALPVAAGAALKALEKLALPAGSQVVIVGASGGVGRFAVQLAKLQGLTVIATGAADASASLHTLGADVVLDHHQAPLAQQLQQHYPQGVDGIIDLASDADGFSALLVSVNRGGAAVSTLGAAQPERLRQRGLHGGNLNAQINAEELALLVEKVARGELQIPLERIVSIRQAPAMLAANKAGGARGKTVLNIDW
ncbi:NADP-dependent oxidoreductase [Serratia sp. AKBS12]|uniref:NADP-dependent oxidoreductase n=1 Tax=Serratia sp. AKBS12 TaxID=2974597 RepID=UPI0021659C19|nr:NADP-dependent oxidoreductase [Serratia sp. AKBS12]MCS3408585.1 NADP-dependent oxidoreductase [Serratia sp. AKBS12]